MRIGIDLFPLVPGVGRGGGFQRYATALVRALYELNDDHRYYLFVNYQNRDLFPSDGRFVKVTIPLPAQRQLWPFRLLWQHVWLPMLARHRSLDVVHFPMDTASLSLRIPYVLTINDVITDVYYPIHFPKVVSPLKARYLFATKGRSARRARLVICPSKATALEVSQHYRVPLEKVSVIPLAADRLFTEAPRKDSSHSSGEPPYIISVVSLSPHKNIETVVRAFMQARATYDLPHELRIIGMPGTGAAGVQRFLSELVRGDLPIRYLGFIDDNSLLDAYRGAALMVFLPFVEGFGLPPLEAMAAGVPVISSSASSLPEVCGNAALLVPPDNVEAAAAAIGKVLTQRALALRLVEEGRERVRIFSWERVALDTRAAYERALTPLAGQERSWTNRR
jgi:glycosyltransferase involved in cell wall biosynthesis